MAPNFQSSFIPKDSPTQSPLQKKSMGLSGMIGILVLVVSIALAIGLFVYTSMVKSNIESLKSELDQAAGSIDDKTITEMTKFSERLSVVQGIVDKHQVISNFLNLLSSLTVSNVEYNEFHYSIMQSGTVLVTLNGKARDYATIAVQQEIFSKNKFIKSSKFEELQLSGKGQVSFKLTIEADPQIAVYAPAELQTSAAVATTTSVVSTTTTSRATTTVNKTNQ